MISLLHILILVIILFSIGLLGVIIRRNLFFILLSLEIMFNSTSLAFIAISRYLHQLDGQIACIVIITLSAAKAGVCLVLFLRLYRQYHIFDVNKLNEINR